MVRAMWHGHIGRNAPACYFGVCGLRSFHIELDWDTQNQTMSKAIDLAAESPRCFGNGHISRNVRYDQLILHMFLWLGNHVCGPRVG